MMDESEYNIGAYGNQCMFSDEETPLVANHEDAAFNYCEPTEEVGEPSNIEGDNSVRRINSSDSGNASCSVTSPAGDSVTSPPGDSVNSPPGDSVNSPPADSTGANGFHSFRSMHPITLSRIGDGENVRCYISEETLKAKRKVEKIKAKKAAGWTKANDLEGHKDFNAMDEVLEFLGEAGKGPSQQQKKKLRKRSKLKSSSRQEEMNGKCNSSTASDSDPEHSSSYCPLVDSSNNGSNMNGVAGAQLLCDNSITGAGNESGIEPSVDEEFKEVHRKKKVSHKYAANMERTKPTLRAINRHNKQDNRVASASASQPKAPAVPEVAMDLSLNSFPVLESQYCTSADTKSSVHTESTRTSILTESTTDDDRDSVASQSTCNQKCSWAKVAAKPNTTNPSSSANEFTASLANLTSQKAPSTDNNAISSSVLKTNSNTYQTDETFPNTDQNSLMTRSVGAISDIEFGTVTTSSDMKVDIRVHDILSQSFTEGQTRFKMCAQSKNLLKSGKVTSNKNSRTAATKQRSRVKGVEFFDKSADQPLPTINVFFGFDNTEELAQVDQCLPSLSLNPLPISQHNPTCSSSPTTPPIATFTSTTSYKGVNALPQTTDVLPQILAASCDKNLYNNHSLTRNCIGNFNVANAVAMLRKEWNVIKEMRNKYGNESVKFSEDLTDN